MLTLYVIPSDDPKKDDFQRVKDSFSGIDSDFVFLNHRDIWDISLRQNQPWYGYLFGNEWIDSSLRDSLPYYLAGAGDISYLVFYKKVYENVMGVRNAKLFQAPRLFKKDVRLKMGQHVPEDPSLKYLTILDGWILETDRVYK